MSNQLLVDKVFSADFGFGYGKAKYQGKEYRQPSVIGEPRRVHDQDIKETDIQYGVTSEGPNNTEIFEPIYFVGNLAVRHSNTRYYSIGDNRPDNWTTAVQLDTMLACLAPNEEVFVVTGLPLDFYFDQLRSMNQFLDNFKTARTISLQIGNELIKDVSTCAIKYQVVPQPSGACMNYLLDDRGQFKDHDEARQILIVGDLGFHTFDLLIYDNGEIHRKSHSDTEISISNAYKMIQEWLRPQVQSVPDLYTLDAAMLQGNYQGIDLTKISSRAFESLSRQIQFAIDSLNMRYHKYIGTGGWSSSISHRLSIPKDKLVVYGQDGNIDGYHKIGVRKCLL